ncbi:MAG: undecaprenyl-diphosphate phosphatase [candidate division WS1 bacterium]|nr:undecaprenyl-diphosphate phosphatase [candidate division WS1 bacterium]
MSMALWQALVLAVIQGLTEFLPVSSKSHLMVAEKLMGVNVDDFIALAVLLHFGTLLSLIIYYRRDWAEIIGGSFRSGERGRQPRRLLGMLALGTLPVAVVGLLIKDHVEFLYEDLIVAGALWLVTATGLWYADRLGGRKGPAEMRPVDALWVGVAQTLAILPGISRSGSTIFGGLARRFDEQWAPRFAFLLATPAILGATVLKSKDLIQALQQDMVATPWGMYALTCAVSAAVGYVAIALVIRAVRSAKLKYFAVWCAVMGITTLVWGLWVR